MKIKDLKNQGLRKYQVLQTWFFSLKKLDLYHKPEKIQVTNWKKNPGLQDLKFFEGFEADLDFPRPWFSEMKSYEGSNCHEFFKNLAAYIFQGFHYTKNCHFKLQYKIVCHPWAASAASSGFLECIWICTKHKSTCRLVWCGFWNVLSKIYKVAFWQNIYTYRLDS